MFAGRQARAVFEFAGRRFASGVDFPSSFARRLAHFASPRGFRRGAAPASPRFEFAVDAHGLLFRRVFRHEPEVVGRAGRQPRRPPRSPPRARAAAGLASRTALLCRRPIVVPYSNLHVVALPFRVDRARSASPFRCPRSRRPAFRPSGPPVDGDQEFRAFLAAFPRSGSWPRAGSGIRPLLRGRVTFTDSATGSSPSPGLRGRGPSCWSGTLRRPDRIRSGIRVCWRFGLTSPLSVTEVRFDDRFFVADRRRPEDRDRPASW